MVCNTHTHSHTHLHTLTHTHAQAPSQTHKHQHRHIHTHAHTQTHTHTHTNTHKHTHIHTHIKLNPLAISIVLHQVRFFSFLASRRTTYTIVYALWLKTTRVSWVVKIVLFCSVLCSAMYDGCSASDNDILQTLGGAIQYRDRDTLGELERESRAIMLYWECPRNGKSCFTAPSQRNNAKWKCTRCDLPCDGERWGLGDHTKKRDMGHYVCFGCSMLDLVRCKQERVKPAWLHDWCGCNAGFEAFKIYATNRGLQPEQVLSICRINQHRKEQSRDATRGTTPQNDAGEVIPPPPPITKETLFKQGRRIEDVIGKLQETCIAELAELRGRIQELASTETC